MPIVLIFSSLDVHDIQTIHYILDTFTIYLYCWLECKIVNSLYILNINIVKYILYTQL